MIELFKRTWAQIDLDALTDNYRAVKSRLSPGTDILAVVKADAYGHGFERTVRELCDAGCEWFGVSNLEEALQVRGICDSGIFILGYTPPEYAIRLALNNISQAVFNLSYGRQLAEGAAAAGVTVNVHIKIDTGMTRLGFTYSDSGLDAASADEIASLFDGSSLYPEGVFTHFARADETGGGEVYTRLQFDLFLDAVRRLEARGVAFSMRHCCNSAAALLYPEMQLDLVRPGIILYGLHPSDATRGVLSLRPCMELKTVISMIKSVRADTPVSYGGKYVTPGERLIATVPMGYADGYPRALSGGARMLVAGQSAPVVGRICMDQCMLDVTDIDGVREGMTVTAFGSDSGGEISVDSLADRLGTINYELVCGISKRVPRVYIKGKKRVSVTDYILP